MGVGFPFRETKAGTTTAWLQNVFVFLFLFFRDRVSLYSFGCPGTHSVDQAGLELRNLPEIGRAHV